MQRPMPHVLDPAYVGLTEADMKSLVSRLLDARQREEQRRVKRGAARRSEKSALPNASNPPAPKA